MSDHPFNEHIPALRRYAIALLRDRSLADDLVQDTLERGLNKLSFFKTGSNLRAWLFTIMHNLFVNQLPQSKRWQHQSIEESDTGSNDFADEMLTTRDFMQALQALSDDHRATILLIGLEQLTYEQAAKVLNLPVGTVMSRLARARERLSLLMNGDAGPQLRRVK